jgi:hypothetical protein
VVVSDIHIDDFYKDAARILVLLYSHFPRKITLYVDDISGPDTPDEFGLHSPRHQACFHTMLWLASTGYLDYGQMVYQDALDEACLTHKAFLLLNSVLDDDSGSREPDEETPAILAGLDSLAINRLKKELNSGTSYSLAKLMKQLMDASRRYT